MVAERQNYGNNITMNKKNVNYFCREYISYKYEANCHN